MIKPWSAIKNIIETNGKQNDIFLSVIDDEGTIVCANSKMARFLHLQNPRITKTNFFDFLHPDYHEDLNAAIRCSEEPCRTHTMELFLKNGYYHPMKWQVSSLQNKSETSKTFLCMGHKLLDEERMKKFQQLGEKNYQLILQSLNTGILFQDKNGELIAANQKASEIFNTTLERLYQLHDLENLWDNTWTVKNEKGDHVVFEDTAFVRALKMGKAQEQLLLILLNNGEERWIQFKSQPLFEEGGTNAFAVVSNIADLTLEKKLSVKLRESEVLFQGFMKQTSNHAWVLDENCNLVFANDSFYSYYSLDKMTSCGRQIKDLWPAAMLDSLYEKHILVLQTGLPVETVEKIKWADGTDFIFHVNIFPINGIDGKRMIGAQAVNTTSEHEAEKKLHQTNERLMLLNRATSDAIWEWDMQSGHIFRNDALMDMVGYHFEDAKGLSWWLRRIHPEDRNRISDTIKNATDHGKQSWEEEYRFKCADNTYKYILDHGYVVYENGLPVRMIGSLQDVTGIKELEQQLVEEKLERQKEISETVIEVQEKERTRIGHELHDNVNQILSTVKLYLDMLKPSEKEEKQIKEKSIEYVLTAINEIRKLSKELAAPQLNNESIVASIRTMTDDIGFSGHVKIKFTHDYENDLLSRGKKLTLFRIVQEQMKNIINHSKAKNVDIFLQSKGNVTQLIIKDDGVGFNSKKTHNGIGLSNIHERAHFYNGTVDIQTSPGNGCTLTVTLPSFSS